MDIVIVNLIHIDMVWQTLTMKAHATVMAAQEDTIIH
jgi:hypothetical protein